MADQQGKRPGEGPGERQSESMVSRSSREGERGLASRQVQDPFSLMDAMLDRMQRDFFGPSLLGSLLAPQLVEGDRDVVRVPRTRMRDAGDAIVVTAELPGLDPDDVQIELQEDTLTIRGETRKEEESDGGRVERYVGFYRQVELPEDIDVDQAQASGENGVLTIRFPKRAGRRNVRQIPVTSASREQQPKEAPGKEAPGKEKAA